MIRPKGGRANPRAIFLRDRAQLKAIRTMERRAIFGTDEENESYLTPEMRVGYLRARLEDLERERKSLDDRSIRVRLFLSPKMEERIRIIKREIASILIGIAEGTLTENRVEYEIESIPSVS